MPGTESALAGGEAKRTSGRFLYRLTALLVITGSALATWPLIDSMNPSAEALAPTVSVDLGRISPGRWKIVYWRELPILVVHRMPKQIAAARADDGADLLFPETDRDRVQRDEWLVVVPWCYFGFLPWDREPSHDVRWFCPHGDHYDNSGRLLSNWGVGNFPVPPYYFLSDRWLVIGDESGELGLRPFPPSEFKIKAREGSS